MAYKYVYLFLNEYCALYYRNKLVLAYGKYIFPDLHRTLRYRVICARQIQSRGFPAYFKFMPYLTPFSKLF